MIFNISSTQEIALISAQTGILSKHFKIGKLDFWLHVPHPFIKINSLSNVSVGVIRWNTKNPLLEESLIDNEVKRTYSNGTYTNSAD